MYENDEQHNVDEQRSVLEVKVRKLDEQIALLNGLKSQCLAKLKSLPQIAIHQSVFSNNNQSLEDKIALFKSYFRGRDDVYAKLWINNKTGKRGYSPVCKHQWDRALCRKPAIKCSECPNQGFLSPDEIAIRQHLTGAQVMGVYPMLKNESCYFLAMDFDKEHWLDDVKAIMKTCCEEGIPAAVERSRSGNGGHVWVFFSEEVPAPLVRRLGSFLITKTMSRRYQMDMKSYDRLFPNQDTMPKGGFGNLIALPFQKEAMVNGNSLFIDRDGKPYPDQWVFLASVKKMSCKDIEAMTEQAVKAGEVIAARSSPVEEDDESWMRLPSGKKRFKVDVKDFPKSVDAVLANRIYIKTGQGPSVLYNQLKHLAAFQNPEFYKKQRMRFSTHAIPRVICCAEIFVAPPGTGKTVLAIAAIVKRKTSRMVENRERNQLIVDDIIDVLDAERFPLILTERREHLEALAQLLQDKVECLALLHGGIKPKQRRDIFERMKDFPADGRKAILATGSYIGEGFDEPRLDTLFLTIPSSFKGRIVQYAGRLHRYHEDKQDIRIYDYVDHGVAVLERMFQRRLKTYKMLGYEMDNRTQTVVQRDLFDG